jgi:hypothetical protein
VESAAAWTPGNTASAALVICAFEFEDRTGASTTVSRCGSLNEDLNWSEFKTWACGLDDQHA